MPHTAVQVLNKARLLNADWNLQSVPELRIQLNSLSWDEPTAIQKLHKVVLKQTQLQLPKDLQKNKKANLISRHHDI